VLEKLLGIMVESFRDPVADLSDLVDDRIM
jgi:hypothetical protein